MPTFSSSVMTLFVSSYNPFRGHYQNHHQSSSAKSASARPLPLSEDDLQRLNPQSVPTTTIPHHHQIIPIVLLDALLPNQRLYFSSQDPKFEQLLKYLHATTTTTTTTTTVTPACIGIMGLDPQTGYVLSTGVLCHVPIHPTGTGGGGGGGGGGGAYGVTYGITQNNERVMATSFKATTQCFQVLDEPWMDPTNSFYMAKVVTEQQQQQLQLQESSRQQQPPPPLSKRAEQWFASIPTLVSQWKALLYQAEWVTPANLVKQYQLDEIGSHIPTTATERAWWVAALLNPVGKVPLNLDQQRQVIQQGLIPPFHKYMTGSDLRPYMLECDNDEDRLLLAVTGIQASCDFLRHFIEAERKRKQERRRKSS
ncbi:hypothetical protein IV203_034335 [Nitzschia inconspicua]|uniref:Uncharacterized protein n=1 Tax=Nitzschia inconspicua TaxID=303405 RepID=A0A9K3M5R7_9STRA|nr:hypothetical protein IV203_034335 [Nitzschia inconspicua]